MNYILLTEKAKKAQKVILESNCIDLNNPQTLSILNQLEFIIKYSEQLLDPKSQLKSGETFTYSIAASREFTSPNEIAIKEHLDQVSREMFSEDYKIIEKYRRSN